METLEDRLDACIRDIQLERPGSFIERTQENGELLVRLIGVRNAEFFAERFGADPEGFRITNLADPRIPPPLGFFNIRPNLTSLFISSELEKLTTDFDRDDGSLRGLQSRGDTLLVQLWDGTLGWIHRDTLKPAETSSHWSSLHAVPSDPRLRNASREDWERVVEEARSYLGVPYELGGRSRNRIDCSGLTSRVLRDSLGVVLPRHSTDQRRWGVRVSRPSMAAGDLIFARWETANIPHVGWVAKGGAEPQVIHASQEAGKVVEESLSQFLEGYRFMGCKRLRPPTEKT